MLNSGHRGLHGHGHLHQGPHGGILHHRHGDNLKNLPTTSDVPTTRLEHKEEHKQAQCYLLLRHKSDSVFFTSVDLIIREGQSERELCTDTLSRSFSAFQLSDAHVTQFAHFSTFTVQGRSEKSFQQVTRR